MEPFFVFERRVPNNSDDVLVEHQSVLAVLHEVHEQVKHLRLDCNGS